MEGGAEVTAVCRVLEQENVRSPVNGDSDVKVTMNCWSDMGA